MALVEEENITSRLILRNIPKYYSEEKLTKTVQNIAQVKLTDVRIPKTSTGVCRQIAFIGLHNDQIAQRVKQLLNQTYLDSSKITVSFAVPPGSSSLPRPWSRYTPGSSAFDKNVKQHLLNEKNKHRIKRKKKNNLQKLSEVMVKKQKVLEPKATGATNTVSVNVKVTKAGMATKRKYIKWNDETQVNNFENSNTTTTSDEENHKANELSEEEPLIDNYINDGNEDAVDKEADLEKSMSSYNIELLNETGRLRLLNIPYTTTKQELYDFMSKYGEIAEVYICLNKEKTGNSGQAFVTFAFSKSALDAFQELNKFPLFQGRLLRVEPAEPALRGDIKNQITQRIGIQKLTSYKKRALEKLKQNANEVRTWNLLYVSANSSIDVVAKENLIDKETLLGISENNTLVSELKLKESMAVRLALSETHIIQKTKEWLNAEGISSSCFEREGVSLLESNEPTSRRTIARSSDTIIVKHLPLSITEQEITKKFAFYGPLNRCVLSPSKTVAIVQFLHDFNAKKAFSMLAYTELKQKPIFLEWAPVDVFTSKNHPAPSSLLTSTYEANYRQNEKVTKEKEEVSKDTESTDLSEEYYSTKCIYVKNLNFVTTEETLKSAFSNAIGLVNVTIAKKKKPVKATKNEENSSSVQYLSKGFGFLYFQSPEDVKQAITRFQNIVVDGHTLELCLSKQESEAKKTAFVKDIKNLENTKKLLVRNLPFQVTKRDLEELFSAFGTVVSVRIPKKIDKTSRGYGFIEFLSSAETIAALTALQHTHLLGRKMNIELANESQVSTKTAKKNMN